MIMITTNIGAQNIQQSGFPGDIWRRWDMMIIIVEVVFMPSSFPVCRNLIYHKWLGDILLTWLAIYCKPWGHLYRKPQSQTACRFSLPDFFSSNISFNISLTLWLIHNYIFFIIPSTTRVCRSIKWNHSGAWKKSSIFFFINNENRNIIYSVLET